MISLTRLSGKVFILNADLIERIDTVPDTVITLVDGKKYVVAEAVIEVIGHVIAYQGKIRAEQPGHLDRPGTHIGAPAGPPDGVTRGALRAAP